MYCTIVLYNCTTVNFVKFVIYRLYSLYRRRFDCQFVNSRVPPHALTLTHSLAFTHARSRALSRALSLTLTLSHSHSHSLTLTLSRPLIALPPSHQPSTLSPCILLSIYRIYRPSSMEFLISSFIPQLSSPSYTLVFKAVSISSITRP